MIKVIKILAIGCNLRLMWIVIGTRIYAVRISDKVYTELRKQGFPTAQKIAWQKRKTSKTNEVINSH